MRYIELNGDTLNFEVEGVGLPEQIQLSIQKRGMKQTNFRYNKETKEIEVLCSSCKEWHKVYQFQDGQWVDINKTYKVSTDRQTKVDYFGAKCNACYDKMLKNNKGEQKVNSEGKVLKVEWSKNGTGKQRTIFLTEENDRYIRFKLAELDIKINEFINHVIDEYKKNHPVNF